MSNFQKPPTANLRKFAILDVYDTSQQDEVGDSFTVDQSELFDNTCKVSLPDSGQVSKREDEIDVVNIDETKDGTSSSSSSQSHEKLDQDLLDTCE